MTHRRAFLTLVVGATTAAGLIIPAAAPAVVSAAPKASVSAAPKAAPAAKSPKSASEVESIEEYLGFGSNAAAQQRRLNRQINESVQKCMKAEGFEYRIPPDTNVRLPAGTDSASLKEFAAKYGYGISTSFDPKAVNDPAKADPNAAIVAKLSEADKKAYQQALTGRVSADGFGGLPDQKSCFGKSLSFIGDIAKITALFAKYQNEVEKRVNAKPEVIQALKKWSSCMKEKGYTYRNDGEVSSEFFNRLNAIVGSQGFGAALGGAPASTKKVDSAALARLQKEEIATATRDLECNERHLGVRKKIKRDLDRAFIEANQPALDAFRKVLTGV